MRIPGRGALAALLAGLLSAACGGGGSGAAGDGGAVHAERSAPDDAPRDAGADVAADLPFDQAAPGDGDRPRDGGPGDSGPGGPTYHGEVASILASRCVPCHRAGDIAPFELGTYADVRPRAALIAEVVAQRRMPPLPPEQGADSGCPRIDDPRNISPEEVATLVRWVASGAPEGERRAAPDAGPATHPLGPPTAVYDLGRDYTPPSVAEDDYRCLVIDPGWTTPMPVRAVEVRPGNRRVVHHVNVFVAEASLGEELRRLEGMDPAPGYDCFGGVGVPVTARLDGWVPGHQPRPPPAGVGYELPPGTRIILQMHYNVANGTGPDRTALALWRSPVAITRTPRPLIIGSTEFVIPAGARVTREEARGEIVARGTSVTYGQAWEGEIREVFGHMHLLGSALELDLVRPDGSSRCVLRVPRWSFHWQGVYTLAAPLAARPGDRLRAVCQWDNSEAAQPVINGVRRLPREVRNGLGSSDEMCQAGVLLLDF